MALSQAVSKAEFLSRETRPNQAAGAQKGHAVEVAHRIHKLLRAFGSASVLGTFNMANSSNFRHFKENFT